MNITQIVETIGKAGLKAVEQIPNSTVTEETTTLAVPTNIMQWIIFIVLLYLIWKIIFRR